MNTNPLRLALLSPTLLLVGCLSTTTPLDLEVETPDGSKLPYRVAIVPASAKYQRLVTDGEALIQLEALTKEGRPGDAFTHDLKDALMGGVFNDVVVLDPPASGDAATDAYWHNAAVEAQADLLIDIDEVRYDGRPQTEAIWSSYALFLTGPLEMVFPDRRYDFENAEVGVSVYDVNLLGAVADAAPSEGDEGPPAALLSTKPFARQALLRELRVKPEPFSLRYGDRLHDGYGMGSVLKSFLVPTAHLAEENEAARVRVAQSLSASLARNVAQRIADEDQAYIDRPSWRVVPFYLDGVPKVTREGGEWRVDLDLAHEASTEFFNIAVTAPGAESVVLPVVVAGRDVPRPASSADEFAYLTRSTEPTSSAVTFFASTTGPAASSSVIDAASRRGGSESRGRVATSGGWVQIAISGRVGSSEVQTRSWTVQLAE